MTKKTSHKTHLLGIRNSPQEFFNYIYNLWREDRSNQDHLEMVNNLIIELNNIEHINFCLLCSQAIDVETPVFDIIHILEKSLLHLILNKHDFIELIEKLYEGTKNDMASHFQYKPIKKLVELQLDFSIELLSELIKINRPFVTNYISSFYQSLSHGKEHTIHKELISLIDNKYNYVVMGAVNALASFNYHDKKYTSLLQKTIVAFDQLENRNSEEIDSCIVNSYGWLMKDNPIVIEKFPHYALKNKPEINYAISTILFHETEACGEEVWFENLLMGLTQTPVSNKGIIDKLDYTLSGLKLATISDKKKDYVSYLTQHFLLLLKI